MGRAPISRERCASLRPPALKCCPDCAHEPPTLELEWMLHSALLEVMAAIVMRPEDARTIEAFQSENNSGVAE